MNILFEILRFFDFYRYVTKVGDRRYFVSGAIVCVGLLIAIVWTAVTATTNVVSGTSATCSCVSLASLPSSIDFTSAGAAEEDGASKSTGAAFPFVFNARVCPNLSPGAACTESCELDAYTSPDGLLIPSGWITDACDSDGDCDSSVAVCGSEGRCIASEPGDVPELLPENSFAVRSCVSALDSRVRMLQAERGGVVGSLSLSESELREIQAHARCWVDGDVCYAAVDHYGALLLLGSAWGWVTFFSIFFIGILNATRKFVYRSKGMEVPVIDAEFGEVQAQGGNTTVVNVQGSTGAPAAARGPGYAPQLGSAALVSNNSGRAGTGTVAAYPSTANRGSSYQALPADQAAQYPGAPTNDPTASYPGAPTNDPTAGANYLDAPEEVPVVKKSRSGKKKRGGASAVDLESSEEGGGTGGAKVKVPDVNLESSEEEDDVTPAADYGQADTAPPRKASGKGGRGGRKRSAGKAKAKVTMDSSSDEE
jgi:hypothetical protein